MCFLVTACFRFLLLFFRSLLGYLKDSNAAAHSVDSDIFYIVIYVSARPKSYIMEIKICPCMHQLHAS